jgi:hypothetical protein
LANYIKREERQRRYDGLTAVYCRKCGREIAIRNDGRIKSAIGVCCQGLDIPEEYFTPQYVMTDPLGVPVPRAAENSMFLLFPEEEMEDGQLVKPIAGGIAGTAKAIYRAIGFTVTKIAQQIALPESKKIAIRNRKSKLFENTGKGGYGNVK